MCSRCVSSEPLMQKIDFRRFRVVFLLEREVLSPALKDTLILISVGGCRSCFSWREVGGRQSSGKYRDVSFIEEYEILRVRSIVV